MNRETKTALKWGLFIGLANLVWLYVAFWLGLHTNGTQIFGLFMLSWFVLTTTGFVLALRAVRRVSTSWNYWKGVRAGAIAALVTAAVAVVSQVGYWKVVHPEWPQVMVEQTRVEMTERGLTQGEIDEAVETARLTFTFGNYVVQAALGAIVTGVVLSAIIMIFLRRPRAGAV